MTDRGTYVAYADYKFGPPVMRTIRQACAIIDEYEAQGYSLTLRQLYYQFVARGLCENSGAAYSRLGDLVNRGRLAGLVSWTAIEDRTRGLSGLQTYSGPAEVLGAAARGFRLDLWADQDWRPEVWVEKEALAGVVESICNRLRVDFFSCRGYNSQSEQWRAGRRMAARVSRGQRPIVFHLGDHDPSGIDMTRDNRDRLEMFAGVPVQVVRLALNMPQIEELRPPPNPAKITDSRFEGYRREYGESSWELDALDPRYLTRLIEEAVVALRDPVRWDAALRREAEDLRALEEMIEEFR